MSLYKCDTCGKHHSSPQQVITCVNPTSPSQNQLELVAIEYFDKGIPSTLPSGNPYKAYVENHRWGYHAANNNRNCPVCIRNRGR